jgi:hydrogenase-4 component E
LDIWIQLTIVLVVLLGFWVLGSSHLLTCIRCVAWQGALLAALPLLLPEGRGVHAAVLAAAALLLKAGIMPRLLWRAIRTASVRHEVEPLLGYLPSVILGALLTGVSFLGAARLPLPAGSPSPLIPAGGLTLVLFGLLVLVARAQAVTQVVGYLMLENGIFLFGLLLTRKMPFLVETGILLDVFVAVFIMGIMVYRIQQAFDHMDTHNLAALRD